jgi:hypothetical protein
VVRKCLAITEIRHDPAIIAGESAAKSGTS